MIQLQLKELTESEIGQFINEYWKDTYFWSSPSNARGRRALEEKLSATLHGIYKGHEIYIDTDCTCSCKNVYITKTCKIDGKIYTIAKIKNLIKNGELKQ